MNEPKLFVYGASGHGKVVADILLSCKNSHFVGFVDDNPPMRGATVLGLPVWGDGEWLRAEAGSGNVAVALGIGDNFTRQKIAEKCLGWGVALVNAVHPRASVSASARLGVGTVVMAQAAINPDAKIGSGVIVNTAASIDHDVEIGDFAHVAPNAAMGGAARLGMLSQLGLGAVIIQCVSVGARSLVGAGAVAVRDIPDGVVAVGVPARIRRNA